MIEREKVLERKLFLKIKSMKGIALKIPAGSILGFPDRLCLLPSGLMFFAEIKTTNKTPKKNQIYIHKKLKDLGFTIYVIDKSETIETIIEEWKRKIYMNIK